MSRQVYRVSSENYCGLLVVSHTRRCPNSARLRSDLIPFAAQWVEPIEPARPA